MDLPARLVAPVTIASGSLLDEIHAPLEILLDPAGGGCAAICASGAPAAHQRERGASAP
ncbi:MAG: hypothetical protein WB608_17180 [Terracidiphilus sp.]